MIFVNKEDSSVPSLFKKIGSKEYCGEKTVYSNQKLHSIKSVSKTYVLELDLYTLYKYFSGYFKYNELRDKISYL